MDPNRLWAKSQPRGEALHDSMLLHRHLADVHDAAAKVLDATGDDQLLALGLDPNCYGDRFRRCVLLAAALHDLGKANDHFQDMILGRRDIREHPQGLRHEWVSVLLVREQLREWLLPAVNGNEVDFAIVEWAIGGHHPAYGRLSPPRREAPRGEGDRLFVLTTHSEFPACLEVVRSRFSVADAPVFREPWSLDLIGTNTARDLLQKKWLVESCSLWCRLSEENKRFVAAIKSALVAADVAGSALPRQVQNDSRRATWIPDAFSNTPQAGELATIVRKRLNGGALRPFQVEIANAKASVVLTKAGCGTGKTLAAYHVRL